MILIAVASLLLVASIASPVDAFSSSPNNVVYRRGLPKDQFKIATALAKELMNPLGVKIDRFVVATTNDNVIGWAQIKPLGKTAQADPSRYDARPGSYDLEEDVDEQLWEEFENDDNIQVPTGLASLPWTKEYRAMEEAVKDRAQRREEIRAQREQEMETSQLYELSSVFVEPAYRGQRIGTELVKRVLQRHSKSATSVYLLTLATTVDWYRDNFGFEQVSGKDIPSSMAFEVAAGNLITKVIGAQLCCMRGTAKTEELCKSVF